MSDGVKGVFDLTEAFDVDLEDINPIAQVFADSDVIREAIVESLPDHYTVLTDSNHIVEADLFIVTASLLEAYRDEIRERRRESEPVFLPCILACPQEEGRHCGHGVPSKETVYDDIVRLPEDQELLPIRAQSLIQRRKRGLELFDRLRTMERVNDILNRRNEVISVLQRILRHNIRNDISVIVGYLGQIEKQLDEENNELIDTAQETARKLADLADKTRTLTEEIAEHEGPQRFDLESAIQGIVDDVEEDYEDVDVTVEGGIGRSITTHPSLRTVLVELVENACQHASDPEVQIEMQRDGTDVSITISDNGPGIPEYELATITKGEEGALEHGSGIGLWLVGWILREYHDASIGIESTDGGTIAEITLSDVLRM